MNLQQLEHFVAVAGAGGFGRAAVRLGVSQQVVSKRVAALERHLGVALFVRHAAGVTLSAAGVTLLEDAPRLLRAAEWAANRARAATAAAPRLAVATVEMGLRTGLVPAALRACRERHPEYDTPLMHLASAAQRDALCAGAVDVGALYTAPAIDDPELAAERVLDDPLSVALVSPAHPLAAHGVGTLEALAAEPLLMPGRAVTPTFHDRLSGALERAGVRPAAMQEVSSGASTYALVAAGAGWSLEPASYAAAPPPGTVAVRLTDFALPFGLSLAWRRDDRSPALRTFLDAGRAWHRARGRADPARADRGASTASGVRGTRHTEPVRAPSGT